MVKLPVCDVCSSRLQELNHAGGGVGGGGGQPFSEKRTGENLLQAISQLRYEQFVSSKVIIIIIIISIVLLLLITIIIISISISISISIIIIIIIIMFSTRCEQQYKLCIPLVVFGFNSLIRLLYLFFQRWCGQKWSVHFNPQYG